MTSFRSAKCTFVLASAISFLATSAAIAQPETRQKTDRTIGGGAGTQRVATNSNRFEQEIAAAEAIIAARESATQPVRRGAATWPQSAALRDKQALDAASKLLGDQYYISGVSDYAELDLSNFEVIVPNKMWLHMNSLSSFNPGTKSLDFKIGEAADARSHAFVTYVVRPENVGKPHLVTLVAKFNTTGEVKIVDKAEDWESVYQTVQQGEEAVFYEISVPSEPGETYVWFVVEAGNFYKPWNTYHRLLFASVQVIQPQ